MSFANSASSSELELAKAIFERRVGYRVFHHTVREEAPYQPFGVELKQTPVIRLVSVQARANHIYDGIFGQTDWVEIPVNQVVLHRKDDRAAITLPPTVFGTPYSAVRITYEAGLTTLPADIEEAVQMIAQGLRTGEIDPSSSSLPVPVLEVISRYRKGAN